MKLLSAPGLLSFRSRSKQCERFALTILILAETKVLDFVSNLKKNLNFDFLQISEQEGNKKLLEY